MEIHIMKTLEDWIKCLFAYILHKGGYWILNSLLWKGMESSYPFCIPIYSKELHALTNMNG